MKTDVYSPMSIVYVRNKWQKEYLVVGSKEGEIVIWGLSFNQENEKEKKKEKEQWIIIIKH